MSEYPYYIACAMLSTRSEAENKACLRQAMHIAFALDVSFELVNGAYNGVKETSLQLYGHDAKRCARVLAIAFQQETFLEVSGYTDARLYNRNGILQRVFTQRIDGTADNYTEDADGNRYTFV